MSGCSSWTIKETWCLPRGLISSPHEIWYVVQELLVCYLKDAVVDKTGKTRQQSCDNVDHVCMIK